jgi:hypothetical protein
VVWEDGGGDPASYPIPLRAFRTTLKLSFTFP